MYKKILKVLLALIFIGTWGYLAFQFLWNYEDWHISFLFISGWIAATYLTAKGD